MKNIEDLLNEMPQYHADAEGKETNSCYWFNKIKQRDYLE